MRYQKTLKIVDKNDMNVINIFDSTNDSNGMSEEAKKLILKNRIRFTPTTQKLR